MTPLLKAAGITALPPGVTESELEAKILRDNYVGLKVMEILLKRHAEEALGEFRPLETEALRKRVGAVLPAKPVVEWAIISPDKMTSGVMYITATCGGETIRWNGGVKALKTFRFRGEPIPADVAEVYRLHHSAPHANPEYLREKEEQRRNAMAVAMKNQIGGDIEQQVNEALAKLPPID